MFDSSGAIVPNPNYDPRARALLVKIQIGGPTLLLAPKLAPVNELVEITKTKTPANETVYETSIDGQAVDVNVKESDAKADIEKAYEEAKKPEVIPNEGVRELVPPTRKEAVKVKGFGDAIQWYNSEVGVWYDAPDNWLADWRDKGLLNDPAMTTTDPVETESTTATADVKVTKMGVDAYAASVKDGSVVEDRSEGTFTYGGRKYKGPYYYPKSSDPALVEGVEVVEGAGELSAPSTSLPVSPEGVAPSLEAPSSLLPKRFSEIGIGDSTETLTEAQERVVQLANTAKTSALQFTNTVANDNDTSFENGAVWFEVQEKETVLYVNPYGIHDLTDGLSPHEAVSLVNAEVVNAMARASAMRTLSNADLDTAVAVTTEVQLDSYIDHNPDIH